MSGPATARSVALEAIRRVIDLRAYSNLVLPGLLARSRLDARDRAFATELTYGTLRRLLPVDAAIAVRASRPDTRCASAPTSCCSPAWRHTPRSARPSAS